MEGYKKINKPSQTVVKDLKQKHGSNLTLITVRNDTQKTEEYFVFKKYSMMSMKNSNVMLSQEGSSEFDAAEVLFNDALVHGRKEAVDDVDVFPVLVRHLNDLRDEVEVSVKKL